MFTISVHVVPPSVDNCHLTTLPVRPLSVNYPLFVPAQTETFELTVPPCDTGYTVIVKVEFGPLQPLAFPRTEIVANKGVEVAFVAVKAGIAPIPLAARPIAGLLFVQANVVPAIGLVKTIDGTFSL